MKADNKCPILLEAIDYESTLDTLVEWFGGVVDEASYKKLREGADGVADWICVNKRLHETSEENSTRTD